SDAYATGTALVALHQAAGLAAGDPAYRRGVKYLLATPLGGGTWHVRSRSKPVPTYLESGFPHGNGPFNSLGARSRATTALGLALRPAGREGSAGSCRVFAACCLRGRLSGWGRRQAPPASEEFRS